MPEPRASQRSIALTENGSTVVGDPVALEELGVEASGQAAPQKKSWWQRFKDSPGVQSLIFVAEYCQASLRIATGRQELSPREIRYIRKVEPSPSGYPRLAAFMNTDPSFLVFRRFGYLRARLILNQQDKIRAMEENLDDLDEDDNHGTMDFIRSREADANRRDRQRQDLFIDLGEELKAYDDLIIRSSQIVQLEEPQWRNRQGVWTFIWNDGQLCVPDRDYLEHVDDLITLGGDKEHSWVHRVIEEFVTKLCRPISKLLFQDPILREQSSEMLGFTLYTKSRFDKVVAFLFTMIIVGSVMIPVFILYLLRCRSGNIQNAVTFGFTTFFALLCSTCTMAKRHEIFAATAAYCAVLVVFTSQPDKDGCAG